MKTAKIYKYIVRLSTIFICLFFAMPVFAATISFVSSNQNIQQNHDFSMDVMLDPQNENINTVGVDIVFPNNLAYVSSNDNNSIIQDWVESPKLSSEGVVHFSGIIPGGFSGYIDPFFEKNRKPGFLVRLFFRPLSAGTASVIASNIQVYLNDGLGTETHATVDPITLAIQRNSSPDQGFGYDTEPPLDFAPILFHEPLVYDGKFAIIFSAKDAGSGIDYYEVKEGNNSWIHATSPYLINDQSLSNSILVKAVDKAGNERIENVPLPVSTTNSQTIYNFIAVIIVFAILCVIIIWRRCPTQKQYSN